MKYFLIFSFFFTLVNCSKQEKEISAKPIETYFSQSQMLPAHNSCCTFSSLLQIKDRHFKYYHLNNQGDYTTVDIIDGNVINENDSTFYLKPKLDSINQKLSYDSDEFFKQRFSRTKAGLKSAISRLVQKTFEDINVLSLVKVKYGNPNLNENFTLKEDSMIYGKMESFDNESPKTVKKKMKLTSDEVKEINEIFSENFWIEKPSSNKENLYIYANINLGSGNFQIPLDTKIQNYFFLTFKKQKRL
jgi:hypothetical protein